ncbi:MAG TPA: CehA/McbA family metallohydrolase [Myxococcota bacterium]
MTSCLTRRILAPALLLACAAGCGDAPAQRAPEAPAAPEDAGPASANWEVVKLLRESDALTYDPSDGGGRAWLVRGEGQKPYAVSATPDRFTIIYEVGPLGIAKGGVIHFQVSPFWHWTTPQTVDPDALGYTTVTASDPEIELRADTVDEQLLGILVEGRPLVEGDRIEIVYGAGLAGAMPDRWAERRSPFWIGVDGDGDGSRRFLADSPTIDVMPGPAAGLQIVAPTLARPGETIRIKLAFIDAWRNVSTPVAGEVRFVDPPDGIELPESVRFEGSDGSLRTLEAVVREPGVYRLKVEGGPWTAESNPLLVAAEGPRVLWGDLHGHSNYSDGTGLPEEYFAYARDVSGLDVVALTDHDHWGILPLSQHPEMWNEIAEQTRRFYEPGRFVTLLGFEWTSWIHGHRHVLYFGDRGAIFDSVDTRFESPLQLWQALADGGWDALTFAHHSAGGPMPTNWEIPPDPRFEPVTEIVSIHGSSEAQGAPEMIYSPVAGNFVRDALARGYHLGFVGSGDRHDGHPGTYQPSPPQGGLAAILAEEHTREAVREALRERRVYATNGPRILLRTALGMHRMGSVVPAPASGSLTEDLFVQVIAEAPLARIELIRSGELVNGELFEEGELEAMLKFGVADLQPGEYVYVRVVQENYGLAWSSPIFVTDAAAADAD